ncbi:bifunctional proline dehydrogenase/L-glutamate gamma-semialdehyde dehydrogenase [Rhodococcus sp. 14-2470-1a]|uniref:bifunctional proline dehydrogenase/L-glutamate gamma-semialdehyde dehydrogenase n=1 Tax=Rhodococcus sp. 14-2470-1a TaxID=2023150 RepID=UPI00211B099E|nr:bifunctional proline dehydrogenase/L-glutamate gamma-semialdehyde dehydrogenase [Rhodococcus sp. 14-2470-1a]
MAPRTREELADDAVALARRWVTLSADRPADRAAVRLAGLLRDERGLEFAVGFIDGVVRPEDVRVAARNWAHLTDGDLPQFLGVHLRVALRLGNVAARVAPALVVPIAKKALRAMVGHLVLDASPRALSRGLARIRRNGMRPGINLLGEAVMGSAGARARLDGTTALLARSDVDYVSVKVSAVVAPHSPWAFEEAVAHTVDELAPLYSAAAQSGTPKFINLDMEEYHDLDLTIAVFTTLLDRPELLSLEAGIVLQAYLPDSLSAMMRLQDWAARRTARGGAAVKVRVVKGANLPLERVESALHGWPLATWSSKQDTDTNYKRILDHALEPDRIRNVHIGVAGHNLFDLAWARCLAEQRGIESGYEFEMLLGMASATAQVIAEDTGGMLLYTPVVGADEFDVAIAYLVRRLEEGASPENFMPSMFELTTESGQPTPQFTMQENRFRASVTALDDSVPAPRRSQNRTTDSPDYTDCTDYTDVAVPFANTPDTDPSSAANRGWGRGILERAEASGIGEDLVVEYTVDDPVRLDELIQQTCDAGVGWGSLPSTERARILRSAARELSRARADLLEVMAAECGKTLEEGDPEVSEAIDFAGYYAELAEELAHVDAALHRPRRLTVVAPPWNFPVAIPAGSTLAALAAGSAVVIKPAPQAKRCGSVMVDALWRAGVPRDVLRLVHVDEASLAGTLVADPRVDQVILTGGYETAELFHRLRPGIRLFAETSGKNAMVVTPSADLDLAVKDLAKSAFGHAGQKCSAASLAILVGSVGTSDRFLGQLVDAVRSMKVAYPTDPESRIGPLVEPASGKVLRGLTHLDPGESWLLEPRALDDESRLWSPGIRVGVSLGSEFHRTEYFGPILGIITVATLAEAIEVQNDVDYGLTAGLHSLDDAEQAQWIQDVAAGNLYVGRGITGAVVRRQPFGGWKKSTVGTGSKAGGPNYLVGLSDWSPLPSSGTTVDCVVDAWAESFLRETAAVGDDLDFLRRSLASDLVAWDTEFGVTRDVSHLGVEANVLRYLPTPVTVRAEADARPVEVLRVVAAGLRARSPLRLSVHASVALGEGVLGFLTTKGLTVDTETDWARPVSRGGTDRTRVVGSGTDVPTGPSAAVWSGAVTEAGRVEMLPFLREQALSITHHRFGTYREMPRVDALLNITPGGGRFDSP